MTQSWDPQGYAHNARFVAELGMPVVELLAPRAGERILDLGCGDGFLTARLAAMGVTVVGVDASAAFITAARALGLDARLGDAQRLAFAEEFDAVFSNAVLHWSRRNAGGFAAPLPAADRPAFLSEVQEDLRPALTDAQGRWTADYTRLRFRAIKPAPATR